MKELVEGFHRFQQSLSKSERESFKKLAGGQNPLALFITCSDSRIDPNWITQSKPGDLFILRNAGNIIPPYGASGGGEAATIEYAVANLGVKEIIVCGHTYCGAMQALLSGPESVADLPAARAWLGHAEATRRITRENYAHLEGNSLLTAAVQENVLVQLENLRTHPVIAAGLVRGTIKLYGWVYKIDKAEVFAYVPGRGQFLALPEHPSVPIPSAMQLAVKRII